MHKKLRFEIFKRDGFKCCYCGRTPPTVILEVDHIEPKAKGGSEAPENLITACFDCNRGKRDIPLSSMPNPLCETMEQIREREAQIKGYRKLLRSVEARFHKDISAVNETFMMCFPGLQLTERFKELSLRRFLEKLPLSVICEALKLATARIPDADDAIKYFCGICWNKIKEAERV